MKNNFLMTLTTNTLLKNPLQDFNTKANNRSISSFRKNILKTYAKDRTNMSLKLRNKKLKSLKRRIWTLKLVILTRF